MFLLELKRGLNRKSFKLTLIIELVLIGIHLFEIYPMSLSISRVDEYTKAYLISSYEKFMSFELSKSGNIFIIMMPILAALPFSDTYLEDISNGFNSFLYTRYEKYKYCIYKYIVNFLIGGITIAIPLVIDFIGCSMLYPSIQPNNVFGGWYVIKEGVLPNLFASNPNMYILITIFINFLFGGIFSSIALSASIFTNKRFIVVLTPFIISLITSLLLNFINKYKYDPSYFLYGNRASIILVFAEATFIIMITSILFYYGDKKNEF